MRIVSDGIDVNNRMRLMLLLYEHAGQVSILAGHFLSANDGLGGIARFLARIIYENGARPSSYPVIGIIPASLSIVCCKAAGVHL